MVLLRMKQRALGNGRQRVELRLEGDGLPRVASSEFTLRLSPQDEEDVLSATVYASLPYPENQLVALAHSLVARGVIDEAELKQRLATIRERLEA